MKRRENGSRLCSAQPECGVVPVKPGGTQPASIACRAIVQNKQTRYMCMHAPLPAHNWLELPGRAVVMAFAKPDMTFTPGSFSGTGLQYLDQYYSTVKNNVNMLKLKGARRALQTLLLLLLPRTSQPLLCAAGTRVLLAIGGATYSNWCGNPGSSQEGTVSSTCSHTLIGSPAGAPLAGATAAVPVTMLQPHWLAVERRNGINNGAIAAFVADMGFNGVRCCLSVLRVASSGRERLCFA